jgi:hypothetical protein
MLVPRENLCTCRPVVMCQPLCMCSVSAFRSWQCQAVGGPEKDPPALVHSPAHDHVDTPARCYVKETSCFKQSSGPLTGATLLAVITMCCFKKNIRCASPNWLTRMPAVPAICTKCSQKEPPTSPSHDKRRDCKASGVDQYCKECVNGVAPSQSE